MALTSKKAFKVWILVVFAFLTILGTLHAWFLWQFGGIDVITFFSYPMEITTYFIIFLVATFCFLGAICYVAFRSDSFDLPLYKLSRDFEEKLEAKSEEIKGSTEDALAKLGLGEFQLKESIKTLEKKIGEFDSKLKEGMDSHEKILKTAQKNLSNIETRISKIENAQRELPELKKNMQALEVVEKDLKNLQGIVEKSNSVLEPYLFSTDDIQVLEGKVLKQSTIKELKSSGMVRIVDLLFKSPVEIALTKSMSESEAKSLQSVIQLLMVPGVQHDDAVLLLKSGINSKQELSLQDTFALWAKVAKVAELYIQEGKIKEEEKPTLEEIASWIKLAKAQ